MIQLNKVHRIDASIDALFLILNIKVEDFNFSIKYRRQSSKKIIFNNFHFLFHFTGH